VVLLGRNGGVDELAGFQLNVALTAQEQGFIPVWQSRFPSAPDLAQALVPYPSPPEGQNPTTWQTVWWVQAQRLPEIELLSCTLLIGALRGRRATFSVESYAQSEGSSWCAGVHDDAAQLDAGWRRCRKCAALQRPALPGTCAATGTP
jgi:hypothetical protein